MNTAVIKWKIRRVKSQLIYKVITSGFTHELPLSKFLSMISLGIIREGKTPPDKRVPLTPVQCAELMGKYGKQLQINVQPSSVRYCADAEYSRAEVPIREDLSDSQILLGVKEVPIHELMAGKHYFFFSHTIKEQPYNRDLLKAVLERNITLTDWECLTKNGFRIIGFGRYAGLVGAYNGLLTYGKKYEAFQLKPAHRCAGLKEMYRELGKVKLPPVKIALTGRGRVAQGAVEILEACQIKRVSPEDYLNQNYDVPVFTQLGVEHYNIHESGEKRSDEDFYKNYTEYKSDFFQYARVTDFFIAGHYFAEGSPFLFTREQAKDEEFKIKVVADISCDIDGPVASTLRPSTIEKPIYGYDAEMEQETDFKSPGAIAVMAVDNLPAEIPADASEGFGEMFTRGVLPELINGDSNGVIADATIAKNGKLTPKYQYLSGYVRGENSGENTSEK